MSDPQEEVVYEYEGPPSLTLSRWATPNDADAVHFQHRLEAQGGRAGAVIIGLHDGSVAMVRVWRPLIGKAVLELPRGFGEAEDLRHTAEATAIATASREFLEETGMVLTDAKVLGTFRIDTGVYPQAVAAVSGNVNDSAERIGDSAVRKLEWVSVAEIRTHVARGELADAITLAALDVWDATRR